MNYILAFLSILIACGILWCADLIWQRVKWQKSIVSYAKINRERISVTMPNSWLSDFFERD